MKWVLCCLTTIVLTIAARYVVLRRKQSSFFNDVPCLMLKTRANTVALIAFLVFAVGGCLVLFKNIRSSPYSTRTVSVSAVQKLIILSYMRSGSTLTGALINMHPDVFYIYEPLWSTQNAFHNGKMLADEDKSMHNVTVSEEMFRARGVYVVRAILNCEVKSLDSGTLKQFHMKRSPSSFDYFKCIYPNYGYYYIRHKDFFRKLPTCLPLLASKCQQAKVTSVKDVEVNMRQAHVMMASDDTIKIIHLIRDPRGVLSSRQAFGVQESRDPSYVTQLCARVLEDVIASKRLTRMFPGRILTVRYEDIVRTPIAATKQLYDFVGLDLTANIEDKIWEMTYGGLPDGCNVCPTRTNATETANRWRENLKFETVAMIQEGCRELMSVMGYKSFATEEELLNDRIPSTRDDYDSDLMKISLEGDVSR